MIQIIVIIIAIVILGAILCSVGMPAAAALPVAGVLIIGAIIGFIIYSVNKEKQDLTDTTSYVKQQHTSFIKEKLGGDYQSLGTIEDVEFFKGAGNKFGYMVYNPRIVHELETRGGDDNIIIGTAAYCELSSKLQWRLVLTTGFSQAVDNRRGMKLAALAGALGWGMLVGTGPIAPGDNCITSVSIEIIGFQKRFFIPILLGEFEATEDMKYRVLGIEHRFCSMLDHNFSVSIMKAEAVALR